MGLLDDAIREHLDLKRRRGGDPAEIERAEREALGPVRREPSAFSGDGPATAVSDAPPVADDDVAFIAEAEDFDDPPTMVAPAVSPELDDEAIRTGIAHPDYADPEFDEFAAIEPAGADAPLEPATPVFEVEAEPEHKHRRRLFGRRSHDDDFNERSPLPDELPDDDPFAEHLAARPETLEPGSSEAVGSAQPIQRDEPSVTPPPTLRIAPESEPGNTVEYDVERAFQEEDAVSDDADDIFAEEDLGTPATAPAAESDEDILEETPDFLADTPDHDRLWFEQKPPPDFDFDN